MKRAHVAVAAAFVVTALGTGWVPAQAQQKLPLVLAGKSFTPPIRGEVIVEHTRPVTRREGNEVVTTIVVRNASAGPIARLQFTETWYDKANTIVTGGRSTIDGLLQPGEVAQITVETPYNAQMNLPRQQFSHANGTVQTVLVDKLEVPKPAPANP
ncbi:MAG: hypothetical protein AB7F99_16640 [Vicinamibacterales bacterium]